MSIRKTIRPVTLKRIIQVCSLLHEVKAADVQAVSKELCLSNDRAKEILLELQLIGLLTVENKIYYANKQTKEILQYYEENCWEKLHEYFMQNYRFYKDFIEILKNNTASKGLTFEEIELSSEKQNFNLNQTAITVLSDWCERLGVIQRHLFTRRLYLTIYSQPPSFQIFKDTLQNYYREFCTVHHKRNLFVEIPALREDIAEKLRIKRTKFDELLKELFLANIGKMELSGAPITTLAKKSPFSEKKMKLDQKTAILSPKFEACKQREGLVVGKKAYYYLSIYEQL